MRNVSTAEHFVCEKRGEDRLYIAGLLKYTKILGLMFVSSFCGSVLQLKLQQRKTREALVSCGIMPRKSILKLIYYFYMNTFKMDLNTSAVHVYAGDRIVYIMQSFL